jgi:hypothetical protein
MVLLMVALTLSSIPFIVCIVVLFNRSAAATEGITPDADY